MMRPLLIIVFIFCACFTFAQSSEKQTDARLFAENVFYLSEVMLHDVASPPAAGRFYAYCMLGAYETSAAANGKKPLINSAINEKLNINAPGRPRDINPTFCSIYAMLEVGKNIMPSGLLLDEKKAKLLEYFKERFKLSEKNLQKQVHFAKTIADQVIQYARSDAYNKLSTYPRYQPKKEDGSWFPTPPEYMGAVEPQWATVRSFFLDSVNQFAPARPAPFSRDSVSSFYVQMREVYDVTNTLTDEQKAIANFWDCNPFAVTYSGHMAIGLKKISPGGHWMGITGIACSQSELPLDTTILIHTIVAMTLHDAFISCWNEKYLSNRIRPEAAINKLVDPEWRPLLQTPPFPEFTSGHSVVSSAMSVILTHFFGEHFSYVDTSEEYFGLPPRKFNSFAEAAQEAAISRLYGGIHFRDACELGVLQGNQIATYILQKKLNLVLEK